LNNVQTEAPNDISTSAGATPNTRNLSSNSLLIGQLVSLVFCIFIANDSESYSLNAKTGGPNIEISRTNAGATPNTRNPPSNSLMSGQLVSVPSFMH
jgi:hypothetical protein